jgi:uncharacterized protein YgiM (DUF1202 family)
MATRISSGMYATIIIGSALMASTCASVTSGHASTANSDDTTRITIAKGKFVNPAEMIGVLQPISASSMNETDAAITQIIPDAIQVPVMSAPSVKSRTVAELKNGQAIKVLKRTDSWLKITWQTDNTLNQGWLDKTFVEGKIIHAHR